MVPDCERAQARLRTEIVSRLDGFSVLEAFRFHSNYQRGFCPALNDLDDRLSRHGVGKTDGEPRPL